MSGQLHLLAWAALILAGIWAMHWGSSRATACLDCVRLRTGLRGTVAGALLGLATAAPEISVNVASVGFGWPDLGLGAALGSNVPALPLVFLLSWLSLRKSTSVKSEPVVAAAAVPVQALPYLVTVLLLAVLTLPPAWAGLQPTDALLLLGAWVIYLLLALRRSHKAPQSVPKGEGSAVRALVGVPVIAAGALASVIGARRLAEAVGASDLVAGLFAIGLLCALPESFAAWRLAREDKTTIAVSTAMADGLVSLTIALIPPAIVGAEIGDKAIYLANLGFLIFVLVAYIAMNRLRWGEVLSGRRVAIFVTGYAVYMGILVHLLWR